MPSAKILSEKQAFVAALKEKMDGAAMVLSTSSFITRLAGALASRVTSAEIAAALEALHGLTGPGFALVGSVWRDTRLTRAMRATSPLRFHLRDPDAFAAVIGAAGWTVDATDDSNPVYLVVRLRKA